MYCWGKVRMSLVGITPVDGDLAELVMAIVGSLGAESPRRAFDLPKMEY